MKDRTTSSRLQRALRWHQQLHEPSVKNSSLLPRLRQLQQWQSARLAYSFRDLLSDPQSQPAAQFFLADMYTAEDQRERDASAYRLIPSFQRWLPSALEPLLADAFMLAALSRALDEKVAMQLSASIKSLDAEQYADAYRAAGYFRARRHQIDLIEGLGMRLSHYAQKPGVHTLLIASRLPARLAGATQLQNFLERGYDAFIRLDDPRIFVERIVQHERMVRDRLIYAGSNPFPGFQANS